MKLSTHVTLKRFAEFWWGERGLSVLLLTLLLLFFLSPFIESRLADVLILVFFVLLLVTGSINVMKTRIYRVATYLVAGTALVFSILKEWLPGQVVTGCWQLSALAYFTLLNGFIIRQVFREGPVTGHRVRGAIAVYLLFGITWALIYQLIALIVPGAFFFAQSMGASPGEPDYRASLTYFSFVTMTTLGYGDIVPVHPIPRMFVIMEALIGQLYPATLLARLVSLEITSRQNREEE